MLDLVVRRTVKAKISVSFCLVALPAQRSMEGCFNNESKRFVMEWALFFFVSALSAAVIFFPGFLVFRGMRMPFSASFACAPLASVSAYALFGIVLPFVGISCSFYSLFLLVLVLSGAILFFSRKRAYSLRTSLCDDRSDAIFLLTYIALSSILVFVFFYAKLGNPMYEIQGFDTLFHVNLIEAFMDSGNYSSLNSSLYGADRNLGDFVGIEPGFYPAAWHALCAQIAGLSYPVPLVVNAVNYVVSAVVFPSGLFFFIRSAFPGDRTVWWAGALVAVASFAFPWTLLSRGEQYPLLLSFSMLPSVMALILYSAGFCRDEIPNKTDIAIFALLSFFALAFAQTSALFSVLLFLIFALSGMYLFGAVNPIIRLKSPKSSRIASCLGVLLIGLMLWVVSYKAPFMSGVVSYQWDSFTDPSHALINATLFCFTQNSVANLPMSLLLFVGVGSLLARKEKMWVVLPYVASLLCYVFAVSTEGFPKHFLSGFWYTDPDRVGAMTSIFSFAIVAYGLSRILVGAKLALGKSSLLFKAASSVSVLIILFYSSFSIPGVVSEVTTQNGAMGAHLRHISSADYVSILDKEEQSFCSYVAELVPENSVIVNIPDDGSAFLYGNDSLDVLYRRNYANGEKESAESKLIREALCDYANNNEVRTAVEDVDARYVLRLKSIDDDGASFHTYCDADWEGILSIDQDTEGFSLVAEQNGMSLYKINR